MATNYNIVTSGFSKYISSLIKGNISSIYFAIGKGKLSWDTDGVPTPSYDISKLYSEMYRILIDPNDIIYVDPDSLEESLTPTSMIRIRASISQSEYYGEIREFGLFTIDATNQVDSGTLINYGDHPVIYLPVDSEYIKDIYINL